jgi:FkbM family methyltransferase
VSRFLQRNREMLAAIDAKAGKIERLLDLPDARADRALQLAWRPHFERVWAELRRQQGWADTRPPTRLETLGRRAHYRVARLLPSRVPPPAPAGSRAHLASPVFDAPVGFPPPGGQVEFATPYGFTLVAGGTDMWHPLATGHYVTELAETWLLLELVTTVETFVDVGANIGFFSLLLAHEGLNVVACEPSSANHATISRAVAANGLEDRVTVLPVALGAEPGTVQLQLSALGSGGNSVAPVASIQTLDAAETVDLTTLDALRSDTAIEGRALLKIDVEGLEHAVLRSGEGWLGGADAPIVLVEAWPESTAFRRSNHEEVVGILEGHGYRCFGIRSERAPEGALDPIAGPRGFTPAESANYLALPRWATDLGPRLARPVDLREFTAPDRLDAIDGFLQQTLDGLAANPAFVPTS